MDELHFIHLSEVSQEQFIELMNNKLVRKQLPLLQGEFTNEHYQMFIKSKKRLWEENGYGPWAIIVNNGFAGWGGLQAENGEPDFALVLHPDYWGWGLRIFKKVKEQAFNEMQLTTITILLPPSRKNIQAVTRLGFKEDSTLELNGENFIRFRLNAIKDL